MVRSSIVCFFHHVPYFFVAATKSYLVSSSSAPAQQAACCRRLSSSWGGWWSFLLLLQVVLMMRRAVGSPLVVGALLLHQLIMPTLPARYFSVSSHPQPPQHPLLLLRRRATVALPSRVKAVAIHSPTTSLPARCPSSCQPAPRLPKAPAWSSRLQTSASQETARGFPPHPRQLTPQKMPPRWTCASRQQPPTPPRWTCASPRSPPWPPPPPPAGRPLPTPRSRAWAPAASGRRASACAWASRAP